MSTKENVDELNKMILQGEILAAFEKFYSDDVVMQEGNSESRIGKDVNRKYEEAFVNGMTAFRGAEVKGVAVDEANDVAYVQWHMDFTHSSYGDVISNQVSVQQWKDGQIVHERFFTAQ